MLTPRWRAFWGIESCLVSCILFELLTSGTRTNAPPPRTRVPRLASGRSDAIVALVTPTLGATRAPMHLASQLIRRHLFVVKPSSSTLRRTLYTSRSAYQATPNEDEAYIVGYPTPEQKAKMLEEALGNHKSRTKSPMDVHAVEDIHHLTAEEALRETGTRRDATMRHFTGMRAFSAVLRGAILNTLHWCVVNFGYVSMWCCDICPTKHYSRPDHSTLPLMVSFA
jgi:hypothetical protein